MDDPEDRFRRLAEAARALGVARQWERSGRAWVEAARVAVDAGEVRSALSALDAAGEAFRRDDRPVEARRALEQVLALGASPHEAALASVRLAGLLSELGDAEAGLRHARRAEAAGGALAAVALDTRLGLVLGFRRKAEARPLLDALAAAEGPDGLATGFRTGQIQRLDGRLAESRATFEAVAERLRGREGAESGLAAARSELAELDLLEGEPAAAVETHERARRLHELAGRRSLAYRSEAGRVRAMVEAGLVPLPGLLAEGVAFARDRGLVMLALDLRLALGTARAAEDPAGAERELADAAREADRLGARLHAGRARLELGRRVLGPGSRRRKVLERARDELADHVPLRERAESALES